jgi:hypothetical protein
MFPLKVWMNYSNIMFVLTEIFLGYILENCFTSYMGKNIYAQLASEGEIFFFFFFM